MLYVSLSHINISFGFSDEFHATETKTIIKQRKTGDIMNMPLKKKMYHKESQRMCNTNKGLSSFFLCSILHTTWVIQTMLHTLGIYDNDNSYSKTNDTKGLELSQCIFSYGISNNAGGFMIIRHSKFVSYFFAINYKSTHLYPMMIHLSSKSILNCSRLLWLLVLFS